MALSKFFQKDIDIDYFCEKVLGNKITILISGLLLKCNPDWIQENCFGNVTPNNLIHLIDLSIKNQKVIPILEQILETTSDSSITDIVFERLMEFPISDERCTLLIILSHKKLSEKQLLSLCDAGCAFECFFELAALYYTNSKFSSCVFKDFLLKFLQGKFSEMFNDLIYELSNYYEASNMQKKEILKEYDSSTGDGTVCD